MRIHVPAEDDRLRNARNAQRPARQLHPIIENAEQDHLKSKRGDDEIIIMYPQRRQRNGERNQNRHRHAC